MRARPALPAARLLIPALAIAALAAMPVVYLVVRALGVDVQSVQLLLRPQTIELFVASLGLAFTVGIGAIAIGVPLAWLTARTDLPGRRLWTIATAIPLAIPSYVIAFAFVAAAGPRGALSDVLRQAGLPALPSIYGFAGAAIVLTLATYPYVLIATRAALLRSDPQIEEASRALGDAPLTTFRNVTLPIIVPAIAGGALLAILYTLADFGAVAILQFDSFARAIYVQYRASFDRSLAALLALTLVGVTFLVAWIEWRIRSRRPQVGYAPRRPPRQVPLGRWRWLAVLFCAAVTTLGLAIPAATIFVWLVRGVIQGEPVRILLDAGGNSLLAGGLAAGAAAVMALPIAFLLVRHPGRLAAFIEGLAYSAYAVPGIVLALATVFFVLNVAPLAYQTLLVLVLAYAIRFLPQAIGPARTSLSHVSTGVVEAARTLGDSPARAFRSITLPLLRPGIVAGMALVFLTTVKELPLTLLLGPTGFGTLATAVWGAATEGFYARAAAPAALLMLLSALTVGVLFRAEEPGS
jgi:iron(III) transport system permease protein